MTDEQHWNRLKNEFHFAATEFLNYLQPLSSVNLCDREIIKTLNASRHAVIESYLHVFRFVEDANLHNFLNILRGSEDCDEK